MRRGDGVPASGPARLSRAGRPSRPAWQRYAVALAAVAAAVGVRWALRSLVHDDEPMLLFLLAVLLSALLGGPGPGLLATVLALGVGAFGFSEDGPAWRLHEADRTVRLLFFAVVAPLTVYLVERRRQQEASARRAAADLAASEDRYRRLFDGMQDWAFVYRLNEDGSPGPMIEVNAAASRRLGYSREELLGGMTVLDFVPPEVGPVEKVRLVGQQGRLTAESTHVAKSGERIPAEVSLVKFELDGRPAVLSIARDVAERQAAEAAIRESRERLEAALSAGEVGTWRVDVASGAVTRDANTSRLFGLEPREFTTGLEEFLRRVHPEDRGAVERGMRGAIEGGGAYHVEHRVVVPGGGVRWLRGRGRVLRDGRRRAVALTGAVADITDQKRAEATLRESEQRVRRLIDSLFVFVGVLTPEGLLLDLNLQAERLLGTPAEAVRGRPFWEGPWWAYDERVRGRIRAAVEAARRGEPQRFDVHARLPDGSRVPIDFMIAPMRDDSGAITHLLPSGMDITDRERAEQAVREANFRLTETLSSITDAFFSVDRAFRVTEMNPAAERALGRTRGELVGRRLWECFPEALGTRFQQEYERAMATGETVSFESYFPPLDLWAEVRVYPSRAGLAVYFRDVGDRKRAEAQRETLLESERAARAEAERANRLKDEFVATLSHELRTPLNAVMGWSGMLRKGRLDADGVQKAAEIIERNARAQAQLVSDLLDMSRILSGKLRLEMAETDLAPLAAQAAEAVRHQAEQKGLTLEQDLPHEPLGVRGDPDRLQQVLWNLLTNAIKFTPEGGRVRLAAERSGPRAVVRVEDTGQGIDPGFLPSLFERYRQADASAARRHGGLGLGLAICRQLVAMHGGAIRAESEGEGRGATFTVELPLVEAAPPVGTGVGTGNSGDGEEELPLLTDLRVLVVDDERDSRELMARLLEACGARCRTAGSAAEALAALEAAGTDLLVSDIGMPGEDGYALMRRVRETLGALPAIAVTAYAREEDRERAFASGFRGHVAKPVEAHDLCWAAATAAGRTAEREPAAG